MGRQLLYGETVAIGHNGIEYSMKCGSIADNKVDDYIKTFNDIEDDYVKSLLKHGSGTFKELNEYETTFRHLVFTGICDYYGLVYTKKEI